MIATRSIPLSAFELAAAVREQRPYDASRLDRVLRVEERHGFVEVQAATPWKALAAALRPGDARAAGTQTTMTTVGASLAHNTAGPDGRPAVVHVESIAVVAPGGELRRANRTTNRDLFALVAGGQGLFGALYSVTLDIGSLSRAVNEAAPLENPSPAQPLRLLVPPEQLESFLAEARGRCAEWRMPLAKVETRRTLPESDSFLCWARRHYAAIALQFAQPAALGAAVRATQLRRELIDAAIAHGGSFQVACTPEATRDQAESCYPQLPQFLAEKRRLDPGERMVNPWYLHYRRLFA
jgi:FAD binding domain